MPITAGVRPTYSLVIPIFNEEAVLPLLLRRLDQLRARLDAPAEVIFVDDGSRDTSSIVLSALANDNPGYKYIGLSRNFGQQAAVTAGMDRASGDAVILMDADLQDPPEVVLDMIAKWREGFEIVYAQRLTREGEGFLKQVLAGSFYWILGKLASVPMPANVSDFRLVDRKVLASFRTMREKDRFVRGMFAWMGYRQTSVTFHRPERAAGETKYSFAKLARLAASAIVGFSDAPLRLAIWVGMSVSALAILYGFLVIAQWLWGRALLPGLSATLVVTAFLSGINMLLTGLMGLYVGRIYNEVKGRPLYLVDRSVGFEGPAETEHSGRPRMTRVGEEATKPRTSVG